MIATETTNSKPYRKNAGEWVRDRIKPDQVERYLNDGKTFIDAGSIKRDLEVNRSPDATRVREIIQKALGIEALTAAETACLLNVDDQGLLDEMKQAAGRIKKKVYDNRIVTFAPLYMSNLCINDCQYCGFRRSNTSAKRRMLSLDEVRGEVEVLAGNIGHKRLIVVYGEHPSSDVDYIASTVETIAGVNVETRGGWGQIRRCNVNAAPISVEELKVLREVGIGTFQVFQETYHRPTYEAVHPRDTVKGDYAWRLYSMHRAMEAGVDDVGLGALFGLYDWKFEVMGLVHHAIELESKFAVGPHTISFPRLEPADNTPYTMNPEHQVGGADFEKLVTVIRLAVPYTGMIITAREDAETRRRVLPLGCTQMDASSKIGIGAYAETNDGQQGDRQQFMLGDTRSLDEVIRELAEDGCITSFCTAGYRCGRTGEKIMGLLKCGKEGHLCKLNAVITFREWLDDFATPQTAGAGEKVIADEVEQIKQQMPGAFEKFIELYEKTKAGRRDLFF